LLSAYRSTFGTGGLLSFLLDAEMRFLLTGAQKEA